MVFAISISTPFFFFFVFVFAPKKKKKKKILLKAYWLFVQRLGHQPNNLFPAFLGLHNINSSMLSFGILHDTTTPKSYLDEIHHIQFQKRSSEHSWDAHTYANMLCSRWRNPEKIELSPLPYISNDCLFLPTFWLLCTPLPSLVLTTFLATKQHRLNYFDSFPIHTESNSLSDEAFLSFLHSCHLFHSFR